MIDESLEVLAPQALALADRLCGSCRTFHSVWPYLRLADVVGSLDADRAVLLPLLQSLIAEGRPRVLLAGAADTGLPTLVQQAAEGLPLALTVVDRCATPLALCRDHAAGYGVLLDTLRTDLRDFDRGAVADLVLAHSVLEFNPPADRVQLLARLRRGLRPSGRLVLVGRAGRARPPERGEAYWERVEQGLAAKGIDLPEERAEFRARIIRHGEQRLERYGAFTSADQLQDLLEQAGLRIEAVHDLSRPSDSPNPRSGWAFVAAAL